MKAFERGSFENFPEIKFRENSLPNHSLTVSKFTYEKQRMVCACTRLEDPHFLIS